MSSSAPVAKGTRRVSQRQPVKPPGTPTALSGRHPASSRQHSTISSEEDNTRRPPIALRVSDASDKPSAKHSAHPLNAGTATTQKHRGSGTNGHISTRRPSVQFSEDSFDRGTTRTGADKPLSAGSPLKDDGAFRQNMRDFLYTMYGDEPGRAGPSAPGNNRATMYKAATGLPTTAARTPAVTGPTTRGPLVKGNPATQSTRGDHIDTLVNHLLRAYSKSNHVSSSARGESIGLANEDVRATYSRGDGKPTTTATTPRARRGRSGEQHSLGVDTFVSQAMDSFFGAGAVASDLTSKRSILSGLGADTNFANLLSFNTRSNLQDLGGSGDADTLLEPLYIGQQAVFQSASRRNMDVSVSKSLGPATRVGAPPSAPRRPMPLHDTDMSLNSRALVGNRAPAPAPARRGMNDYSLVSKMSLNSKALGLAHASEAEDSWADLDAQAAAATAQEPRSGGVTRAAAAPVVSSARDRMSLAKARSARDAEVAQLVQEEALKRSFVVAVEHQLRAYIAAERAGRNKWQTRGARNVGVRGNRTDGGGALPTFAQAKPTESATRAPVSARRVSSGAPAK